MINVAKTLKNIRTSKGLTQKQLAEKVGVAKTTISNIERNANGTTLDMFQWILDAMDLEITIVEKESDR